MDKENSDIAHIMKQKLLYVFRFNYLNDVLPCLHEPGRAPMDFLYGMQAIDESRFDVAYVNAPQGPRRGFWRLFFFPFEWSLMFLSRLGFPFELPFLFPEVKTADIVFGVNDAIGFAILFWKRLGLVRGRVYLIVQSAHERCMKHFRLQWFTRRFIGWLLRAADGVFVLAECAKQPVIDYFHVDPARVHYFPFVGDGDFWTPAPVAREQFILSIGNDFNRDYVTVVAALPHDREAVFITTKSVDPQGKRVTIKRGISNEEVRDHYRRAGVVVVSSERLQYESAGYSCAFQSALCGTPLIVSDSPPMREVFTEKEHCLFYEAGNPDALRATLRYAKEHPEEMLAMAARARAHVLKNRTPRHAAESLERVLYANN